MLRVEKGETQATRFTYDASGNRVQALTRDGAKMSAANYLVDENTAYAQVLEERDSSGTLQARYVYGQGYGPILLQRRQKNASDVEEIRTRYLLADGHGSVRQLVTEGGVVTDSYFYDAWGGALSGGSGNTVNPYRYNGQQMDEATGGYYLRARYYQPGNGRFLGHDPVLGSSYEPATLHRYLYASVEPVNRIDPSGEADSNLVSLTSVATIVSTQFARFGPQLSQILSRVSQSASNLGAVTGNQLYTIGNRVLQVFAGTREAGVRSMMEAGRRLNPADIQTRADFLNSMNYGSFSGIRGALNNSLSGSANNFQILWRGNLVNIQWHHIIEQRATNIAAHANGFGINAINSMRNLMPTPDFIHRSITSYYATNGAASSWLPAGSPQTLRAYMTSQTWQTQYELGLKIWQHAMQHSGDLSNFRP